MQYVLMNVFTFGWTELARLAFEILYFHNGLQLFGNLFIDLFSYIAFLILYLTASPFCIFNENCYVSLHSTTLIYRSLHALNKEMVFNIKVLIFKSVKYISRYMISVRYKYTKIVHIYQGKKSVLCTLKNKMTPPLLTL